MLKNTILIAISAVTLFGYDLEFKRNFTKDITQDEIFARINVDAIGDKQKDAIKAISTIINFVDDSKYMKNDNFTQSSYPIYKYSNFSKERYIDGYKSNLSFTIKNENSSMVELYLRKLLDLKTEKLNITYSQLGYRVSKKSKTTSNDNLRLKAIKWSNDYAKELSNTLEVNCKQLSINFNRNSFNQPSPQYARMESRMMSKSVQNDSEIKFSVPSQQLQTLKIDAIFRYNCNDK